MITAAHMHDMLARAVSSRLGGIPPHADSVRFSRGLRDAIRQVTFPPSSA
jgi:hypothetical protein